MRVAVEQNGNNSELTAAPPSPIHYSAICRNSLSESLWPGMMSVVTSIQIGA